MNLLPIYQNVKRVFSKFRKNDSAKVNGDDFGDFVVTRNGETIPRWVGTIQSAPIETELDLQNETPGGE